MVILNMYVLIMKNHSPLELGRNSEAPPEPRYIHVLSHARLAVVLQLHVYVHMASRLGNSYIHVGVTPVARSNYT